jgi:3-phenylpropionate/trans-cinnamate dioxygenase ferredoxin reductase subunit
VRSDGIVVVGAGLGGVRTVEQLRERGYDGRLVLVGEEMEPPYDRPPLSKQVLRGERDVVALRTTDDYSALADVRLGVAARGLDTSSRTVLLDDDTELHYDALVIASGARPRTLPQLPQSGVHVLRTADDCRGLRAELTEPRRLAVVGAGFIGCEVAASLSSTGHDVTVVEMASGPLVNVVGEQVAAHVQALHEAHGVRFRCGVAVTRIAGDARVTAVELADGTEVAADVVLLGLGVKPATEWLTGSDVVVDNGVVCDEHGASTAPGIYAVGDVASWRDARTGQRHRFEHWTSTVEQAAVVAHNLLAGNTDRLAYGGVPYFWSDQYDVKIQSLGVPSPTAEIHLVEISERKRVVLYATEGVLTAVVGFSCPPVVMRMRPSLEQPTSLVDAMTRLNELVQRAAPKASTTNPS